MHGYDADGWEGEMGEPGPSVNQLVSQARPSSRCLPPDPSSPMNPIHSPESEAHLQGSSGSVIQPQPSAVQSTPKHLQGSGGSVRDMV